MKKGLDQEKKKKKKPLLETVLRCGCVFRGASLGAVWRVAEKKCGGTD